MNELGEMLKKAKRPQDERNGWYIVSPELAKKLLERNVKNYRTISPSRVNDYAADMAAGKWEANGEPIVLKDGRLENGQHRLTAIVKANVTIMLYIIFDPESANIYDSGAKRTIGMRFRSENMSITSLNSGTGKIIVCGGATGGSTGCGVVHDYIEENFETVKKAESIVSTKGSLCKKAACSAIAYCLLKNGEVSENEMRMFFQVVNSGNSYGCAKDASPALVLRRQMTEMRGGGGTANQKRQLEITYKAIRDFKFGNSRSRGYNDDTNDAERLIMTVKEAEKKLQKIA